MEELISWIVALIDAGESINGLRLRLAMLQSVFNAVPSRFDREAIVEALAKEIDNA